MTLLELMGWWNGFDVVGKSKRVQEVKEVSISTWLYTKKYTYSRW